MTSWNLKQIRFAMTQAMEKASSDAERAAMALSYAKEIADVAELIRMTRKLTPGETAIAEEYGHKGELK